MMLDIFSSFDPYLSFTFNSLNSSMFWLSTIIPIFLTSSMFWICPTRLSSLSFIPISFMFSQVSQTTGNHIKGFTQIICPCFLLILVINITGIMPYTFSLSSHLFLSLSLALPIWLALILSSFSFSPMVFIAMLLPGHAPNWLNPFLVIIETLSTLVRPLTLSFRLAANMSAGHIVLALMGAYANAAFFTAPMLVAVFLCLQMGYLIFESAICLIQSYIFCLLLSLYSEDHSSKANF